MDTKYTQISDPADQVKNIMQEKNDNSSFSNQNKKTDEFKDRNKIDFSENLKPDDARTQSTSAFSEKQKTDDSKDQSKSASDDNQKGDKDNKNVFSNAVKYIKKNPERSVAITASVGLLAGFLLSRI